MPTTQPSFLARTTLGPPNYLLIAMASIFMLAMAPLGAWKAIERQSSELDAWLPPSNPAMADARWFNEQFDGRQMVLVSWDDCTLGKPAKLTALARRLQQQAAGRNSTIARIETGPQWIERLAAPPYNLAFEGAVARLEGTFVGPPQRDPRGASLGHPSRVTCLAAYLEPSTTSSDAAVASAVAQIRAAAIDGGVDPSTLRIAGPAANSLRTGRESLTSLVVWGGLAIVIGGAIITWRLRSLKLAALASIPAVAGGAAMLSIVFYAGVLEVVGLGRSAPVLGVVDGVILATPILIYGLTLVAAVRLIYGYRDARLAHGVGGAAERAVRDGWPAWGLVALLFAAVMGAFCFSDLLPVRRFGLFAGLGMLASVGAVLSILPVWLHRFPLSDREVRNMAGPKHDGTLAPSLASLFEAATSGRGALAIAGGAALAVAVIAMQQLAPATRLPALASARSALANDYAWFAANVGHVASVEVAIAIPRERNRSADENPEADGQQYRMTLQEQLALAGELDERIRNVAAVSGVISAATLQPIAAPLDDPAALRTDLEKLNLVKQEQRIGSDLTTARRVWRLSSRVAAATADSDIDYGELSQQLRDAINPVLMAYQQRDWLIRNVRERGSELRGASVSILFQGPPGAEAPSAGTPEALLGNLLTRSSVAPGGISYFNLSDLPGSARGQAAAPERSIELLRRANAVVVASHDAKVAAVDEISSAGVNVVDLATLPAVEESIASTVVEPGGPRAIRYVLTGAPLVAGAVGNELAGTLEQTARLALPLLIVAIVCVVWHPVVGLAVAGAVLFPMAAALGAMAWLGMRYDMGIVLVAGLAIGLAIDAVVHYVIWFRRGLRAELFRHEAARMAYARCAAPTFDGLLAVGIGLSVLAVSQSAPFQFIGLGALAIVAATLVSALVLLPSMLTSPLATLMGAEAASGESEGAIPTIRMAAPGDAAEHRSRTDVAAASIPAPTHRVRESTPQASDARSAEAVHGPLQAKLQRLRRASGE